MNTQEQKIRQGRCEISDAQLAAFLRSVRREGSPYAVELVNERLDKGASIEQIFDTEDASGIALSVKQISDLSFRIFVGCHIGPLAGDGCEWQVSFDSHGKLVSAVSIPGTAWVS